MNHTHFKTRLHYKTIPNNPSLDETLSKLRQFFRLTSHIPSQNRTVVIYHLGIHNPQSPIDVTINNLKIFRLAVTSDSMIDEKNQQWKLSNNFYIFNVLGRSSDGNTVNHRSTGNLLSVFLPRHDGTIANVGVLEWDASPSDILTHMRTLSLLSNENLLGNFGSVFMLNNGVRGPFIGGVEGKWLEEYRTLLFSDVGNQTIGMLGPTISCEVTPHVQTHAFILRESIVPLILKEYSQFQQLSDRLALIRHYEVSNSHPSELYLNMLFVSPGELISLRHKIWILDLLHALLFTLPKEIFRWILYLS
jgi:hypothetical protein